MAKKPNNVYEKFRNLKEKTQLIFIAYKIINK